MERHEMDCVRVNTRVSAVAPNLLIQPPGGRAGDIGQHRVEDYPLPTDQSDVLTTHYNA
jgi:hypothetical protein